MIDRQELHAFVDGELSQERESAIRAALKGSPEDAREVEAIRGLKALVSEKVVSPTVDESWKACVRRLDEIDKTKRVERIVSKYAPALCGALFAVILLAGQFGHHSDHGNLSSPDLARMVGNLSPMHPPKQLGFDKDRWLSGLIRESMASTPDHLTVRGVSAGEINGIPVRSFAARDPKGDLTILVVHQPLVLDGMSPMANHRDLLVGYLDGVNCVVRTEGDTTIFVAAERAYEDLAGVAAQVTVR